MSVDRRKLNPGMTAAFVVLAIAMTFCAAVLLELVFCGLVPGLFPGLEAHGWGGGHWHHAIMATLSAVVSLAMLGPLAWRVVKQRNRELGELEEKARYRQDELGQKLQEQHDRFNLALENMTQGLCMFDGDQRLIVSNERYASMYGLPSELMQPGVTLREILEHRIANGYYGESSPEAYIAERMAWVTSGKRSSKIQKLSDGRSVAIVHQPMADGGWLTTHEDVTDRIRSSELLRAVFDNFPGGVATYDADLVLRMANRSYYETLDISEDKFPVGTSAFDILRDSASKGYKGDVDPDDYARERVEELRKFERYSVERIRPDGTILDIEGFPLPDGCGFVSTCFNVTERRQAENLNQRLARIVEDSINEVYVFDGASLKFLQVNAAACRNLGYSEEELKLLTPLDLKPEYTRAAFDELIQPLKAGATDYIRFETSHRRKDGSSYDVEIVLQAMQTQGQPVFAAIVEDITARNRTSDLLHATVQSFPGGISVFNSDLVLTLANDMFYEVLDLPEARLPVGSRYEDVIRFNAERGDYGEGNVDDLVNERMELAKQFVAHHFERERPDGTVVEIRGFPLPQGGFVTTYVDVTERRKSEEALRQSEALFSKVFQLSPAPCTLSNPDDGSHHDVNETWSKLLGYSREEAMAKSALDLDVWADPNARKRFIEMLYESGSVRGFEANFRTKQAEQLTFLVSGELVEVAGETRLLKLSHDITDQKRTERALQQSEELFSKAFQKNPVPFSISDPDGRIYDLNEAWLSTMGYTREEAVGGSSLKLRVWANADERARFVERLEKERAVSGFETQYRTKDGDLVDMFVSGEYVDVGGKPRMFVLSHDITEANKAKKQLVEHRDQLQELVNEATAELKSKAERLEVALEKEKELNELQRQFVSMASHEFRTPLAVIDGMIQRIIRRKGNLSSEELATRAKKIRGAVNTMTNLMESTLSAARMDAGKIDINVAPCDVRTIILDACVRELEIDTKRRIVCRLEALPERIVGDNSALNQVFTNLVSNAVKYSPENPEVLVQGWTEGSLAVVTIEDKGLGIDEDDLPKMFGRFFRAKTSTGIPGTGIGLNLVKILVELHGGSIDVRSRKGDGSTFTVRLPIEGPSDKRGAEVEAA